jgi:DNA invertase Pin-like site-specific DNA recombinase
VVYARVSKRESDPEPQAQLVREWCERRGWRVVRVECDRVTGDPARRKSDPPGLRRALRTLEMREADVLAVFAADRLVRSAPALLELVGRVQQLGCHVASLQDGGDLDTTTDAGELFAMLRGWWSRVELRLIRARTRAGLDAARARGVQLGRPRVDLDAQQLERLAELRAAGVGFRDCATRLGVPRQTLQRLWAARLKKGGQETGVTPTTKTGGPQTDDWEPA